MSRTERLAELLPGLTPLEIFDYYDGPRFYSCRDVVGQLYIVYWIDESDEQAAWLYLRVSPERYNSLKQGFISISEALSRPEEDSAFVVRSSKGSLKIDEVRTENIDPDWMPPADERLSLDAPALPAKLTSALQSARSNNRQVFDLAFNRVSNSYEMSCGKLGRLLDAIQNTIFAFACNVDLDIRRVSEDVKFNSEVLVTGLFESSFGVRLQTKGVDLFPFDGSARALKTLTEMLAALSQPNSISLELHKLNILGRSRFKHFLRMMVNAEISVTADWGAPSGENRQSRASYSQIAIALQKLDATDDATTRVVVRTGRLVGVDVQSDFFAIVVDEDDIIKGKLAAVLSSRKFEIPSRIIATLEETCVIDPLTDREKWSYVLIDAKPPEN